MNPDVTLLPYLTTVSPQSVLTHSLLSRLPVTYDVFVKSNLNENNSILRCGVAVCIPRRKFSKYSIFSIFGI